MRPRIPRIQLLLLLMVILLTILFFALPATAPLYRPTTSLRAGSGSGSGIIPVMASRNVGTR
jgi:hypothetical protein